MADDNNGTSVPDNQNPESGNNEQKNNIPDWMKEAGWETSSGTFDESKPVFDDLDDDDEIVPADIPAWLEEAAPEGFSSDPNATPAFEGLDVDEPFITTGDLVPPPSMQPPVKEEEPVPAQKSEKPSGDEAFDIPTWLENLELHEDSQETAVAWLENMPESLRATEEELQAAKEILTEEPEIIEEPIDELAWVDEIDIEPEQASPSSEAEQAELSEDLVASDLLPETSDPEKLFEQDEIASAESELPSWLKELGDDEPATQASEEAQQAPAAEELEMPVESQEEAMPDWLRTTEETDISDSPEAISPDPIEPIVQPAEDSSDLPDWLGEFETDSTDTKEDEESIERLDDLASEESSPESVVSPSMEDQLDESPTDEPVSKEMEPVEPIPAESTAGLEDIPQLEGVSPNDETLNAQIPDWLSKIEEDGELEEQESSITESIEAIEDSETPVSEDEFETPDSWLDQISEKPPDTSRDEIAAQESEVIDWLDDMEDLQEELSDDEPTGTDETITDPITEEPAPVEMETAKYLTSEELYEEDITDDLPDWLAELREEDEQSLSLEDAIRQTDHDLNDAEVDFLSRADEKQVDDADWLSKLDRAESEAEPEASPPAIELDPIEEVEPVEESPQEPIASGGMLERLKDTAEFKSGEDVPQWLTDIKEEEDPQETAVLWLQQFIKQGEAADIKDEIKRYTDELDPGDSIPKWMEDLKNEEDPQTTAMLWLEKLSANRQAKAPQDPAPSKEEDSGWLADLEKEASQSTPIQEAEEIKDFNTTDEGWLADLDIDEKLKTSEEEIPDWSNKEGEPSEVEPLWMKATSPLEGDFYTDELAGGEDKEVEIPEWLAGYAEGEQPDEDQEVPEEDEYTWLSATDSPATPRTPLDLNKAAISQLEGILGISHQIARGIVTHREKNGPFRDFSDLNNVPEIIDEQTIDILKPEVFIGDVQMEEKPPAPLPTPKPESPPPSRKPAKKTTKPENFEEILVTARARISDRLIGEATELYSTLVKKKKFLNEIIDDLQKASLDHPLEISIQKTLGDAFMQKDMLDEALEAYSKAEDLLS